MYMIPFNLQTLYFIKMVSNWWMNKTLFFIPLVIYRLLKTDFPIWGPYLFESHRSHNRCMICYLHVSLIGSLGCYAMEYVSLTFPSTNQVAWNVYKVDELQILPIQDAI